MRECQLSMMREGTLGPSAEPSSSPEEYGALYGEIDGSLGTMAAYQKMVWGLFHTVRTGDDWP